MKFSILGVGTFGGALASYFKKLNHPVFLNEIQDSECIFLAVPSHAVVSALKKENIGNLPIVVCSKGFSEDGRILSEVLKENFTNDLYFLYAPTLAHELERGELSGMVLAGGDRKEEIKKEIESKYLRIELSDDIVGVQIGASLKNVFTMLVGIAEGLKIGENTQAYFFAKGLEEMKNIGVALGAKPETFLGLAGAGDLLLHSRNRKLGFLLGSGKTLNEAISEMQYTPQGVDNLKDIKMILENKGLSKEIDTPIIDVLFKVLFEGGSARALVLDIK